MKSYLILVILLIIKASTIFAADYSYSGSTGPAFWGNINETCIKGENQSPIDIPYDEFIKFNKPDNVEFYNVNNVEIENKGHSIQISKNLNAKLKIGDNEYNLLQFHFHTPSEHRINGNYHDIPNKNEKKSIEFIELSSVLEDINLMNTTYNYFGSLTTPPCTEGVIWWVAHPVQPIGKDQYLKLRDTMGFNSRYVQVRKGFVNNNL
ncbi:hypothetical protein RclHR1_19050001 [Rhizophagus clarus]|uniref:carbonic anhydrase n=1 Tax=Rhizophagus clarus TaxID=94130 RepID=A0A2Z6QNR0_9GLOM|nr:hypothetical protein RclHR1_19050001 [Rhizophagus clarus]